MFAIAIRLVEGSTVSGDEARADAIFAACEAALADPEGKNLDKALGKHGVAPQAIKATPIRFVRDAAKQRGIQATPKFSLDTSAAA